MTNNSPIRMAILAGVSSDQQAQDHDSIPDQIKTCRRIIEQHKGIETACYIFDGYSRSGYDSLADAMNDIPALKEAVESAEQNKYDVLLLDNWDRLGDLGTLVFTRFRKYKKQIYSARQSGQLHDPATYDPYADESGGIGMHIQGILQNYRLNKIRRGWQLGVPARIEKGLHPLSLAYGYRLTGKDQPAEQIPELCRLIGHMKDMMLSGETYINIARYAEASGLNPPRSQTWHRQTVKRILLNPFYAGVVRFGKLKHRVAAPRSEWKLGKGKHEPLWDEATYRALVAEDKRRREGKRNYFSKYPFTGLTVCGVCGAKISKHGKRPYEYLACNDTHRHWAMLYREALPLLVEAVVEQYKEYKAAPHQPVDLAPLQKQRDELKALRARIHHGYETGIYTDQEAAGKINKLDAEMEEIADKVARVELAEREWQETQEQRENVDIEKLPGEVAIEDPKQVNFRLSRLIERIVLTGDRAVVVWR